jgi:hypothetical protein
MAWKVLLYGRLVSRKMAAMGTINCIALNHQPIMAHMRTAVTTDLELTRMELRQTGTISACQQGCKRDR